MESCVEPAISARVNTIISIAGSASEAIIISRAGADAAEARCRCPWPASASRKRAAAEQRDDRDQVAGPAEQQSGGECRYQRRRDPGDSAKIT